MRTWLALLVLAVPAIAGCASPPADCPVPVGPALETPGLGDAFLATDPTQSWDALVLRNNPEVATWNATVQPAGWSVAALPVTNSSVLEILRVTPGPQGNGNLSLEWRAAQTVRGCVGSHTGFLRWQIASATPGHLANAGKGARVWYAGFWENGTLFDTNIEEIAHSRWPRAAWYQNGTFEPLPVYVYYRARAERSALWSATTAGSAASPVTGDLTLWNYYTTIKGFNEGLKGLSTHTTRVIHMEARDAYPEPVEGHPAGIDGVPLVFYIHLDSVQDLPCPDNADLPCVPIRTPASWPSA